MTRKLPLGVRGLWRGTTTQRCMDFRVRERALLENYGLVAVEKNAVLDVPADGAGENNFFKVAAFADEIFNRVAVGDADHVLLDDGAVGEDFSDVVAGGRDELHAALEGLMVRAGSDEGRQK